MIDINTLAYQSKAIARELATRAEARYGADADTLNDAATGLWKAVGVLLERPPHRPGRPLKGTKRKAMAAAAGD